MAIAFPDHGPAEKRLVYEHIFMVEWRRVQQRRQKHIGEEYLPGPAEPTVTWAP
jgi:hypothetical protein